MQLPLVSPIVHYFKVYYKYAGKKLLYLCCIIFFGGISEGFGVSMLLPVLDYETKDQISNPYSQAIYDFIELLGFEVSLFSLLTLLFVAFLLKGLFYATQALLASYITTNLVKEMRIQFYNNYAEMKYEYYTDTNIGYLNNIVTSEVETAVGSFSSYIDIIVSIIYISIYVFAALLINPFLTLIVLLLCTILFASLRVLVRMSRQFSILISKTNAQIQSLLIQTLNYFKYLKATDSFSHLKSQIHDEIKKRELLMLKNQVIKVIPYSMIEPTTVLFLSFLILYHVNYSEKKITEMLVTLLFFYKTFNRVFSFQTVWQKFNAKIGAIEVIEKTSKDLEKHKDVRGLLTLNSFKNVIELKDVSFSYGDNIVLSDINISISKNKSIGIVGKSGAGKTTIFDILTGLISPQCGKVIVDGTDYSDLDFLSLRKFVGYVTQEPVIINDTIANNISFWKCDYKEEICKAKVEKAAKLAYCDSFIKEAENGYETVIGDKGVKLSGGQRQRISIARELFKEPQIIIFDEATSSLDSESELLIQKSINSIMGKCTIIIIAHRLSTIKNCDYIYVLKEGKLIEEGSFDGLYKDKDSVFTQMCSVQNL